MKQLFFVLLLSALFSGNAKAQTTTCQANTFTNSQAGVASYCTASWQFVGTCNATDLVYSWKISGTGNPQTWQLLPWEPTPITIRGVELTKIAGGPNLWFMAGNDLVPDAMAYMGPSEDHVLHDFPAGTGMPFPSNVSPPPNAYLDLHGGCTGGGQVVIMYTVGYTVP